MGVRAKIEQQQPAVVHGMSAAVYHGDPCPVPSLTSSIAHVLVSKSPRHAWLLHPRLGGKRREPTKEMDQGTVVHALLLGQEGELVVVAADDWRTQAARDRRDRARREGRTAVLPHELENAKAAARAIRNELRALGMKLNGRSEVALFWTETADDGTLVQCRGRIDHLVLGKRSAVIYDLKTCRSAHPRACSAHAWEYGYDIQQAAYRSAIAQIFPALAGREVFRFLFAEVEEPYVLTAFEPAGTLRHVGDLRWRRAINSWAHWVASKRKRWPGYAEGVLRLEAPHYAVTAEEEIAYGSSSTEV